MHYGSSLDALDRFFRGTTMQHARSVTYTFDGQGRPLAIPDAQGRERRYEYNDAECSVWESAPDGSACLWVFDPTPRPIPAHDKASGCTVDYPPSGPLTIDNPHYRPQSFVDPQGGKTVYDYDDARGTVRVTRPDGTASTYDQDPRGRLMPRFDARSGRVIQRLEHYPDVSIYTYTVEEPSPSGAAGTVE
jgi:YD repeat-containing protein